MSRPVRVVKLGGSVLRSDAEIPSVVGFLRRELAAGSGVVAVVSAFEGATDGLWSRALRIAGRPDPERLAAFVGCGEEEATAALALAASAAGLAVERLDAGELALGTSGPTLAATPVRLCGQALERALGRCRLVVVPGFLGRDAEGRPTLLGRGGSDSTAIFLAHRLGGACRLVKDVDGWFDADPAAEPRARRYASLHWNDAIERPAPIVQPEAVRLARDLGQEFDVVGLAGRPGTRVGRAPTRSEVRELRPGGASGEAVA